MANEKKLVEAITSMEEDFAQWYTDVVKKAELCDYSNVKGCMVIKPAGYAIWEQIQHQLDAEFKKQVLRMFICQCLYQRACCRKKRTMWRDLHQKLHGLRMAV